MNNHGMNTERPIGYFGRYKPGGGRPVMPLVIWPAHVTMNIDESFARMITTLMSCHVASDANTRALAYELDALPIGFDWTTEYFIRPNGNVVIVDHSDDARDESDSHSNAFSTLEESIVYDVMIPCVETLQVLNRGG